MPNEIIQSPTGIATEAVGTAMAAVICYLIAAAISARKVNMLLDDAIRALEGLRESLRFPTYSDERSVEQIQSLVDAAANAESEMSGSLAGMGQENKAWLQLPHRHIHCIRKAPKAPEEVKELSKEIERDDRDASVRRVIASMAAECDATTLKGVTGGPKHTALLSAIDAKISELRDSRISMWAYLGVGWNARKHTRRWEAGGR